MNALLDFPATVRLLMTFGSLMLLMRSPLSLGHCFFIGTAVLATLFGFPITSLVNTVWETLLLPETIALVIVVSLIMVFAQLMEKSGRMNRIAVGIQKILPGRRTSLLVYPALVGLLPMPGGAVFSAPMVKEIGENLKLSPANMCFANYWFRHVWEYWWPTYPAVLFILYLSGLRLLPFMLVMFPLSVFAICVGIFAMRNTGTVGVGKQPTSSATSRRQLLRDMIPILIILGFGLSAGPLLSSFFPGGELNSEKGFIGAMCLAILWVLCTNDLSCSTFTSTWYSPQVLNTTYMIITIFVFKEVLIASHAVQEVAMELTDTGIPLLLVVMVLPFLAGLTTGLTIGFVGATFPIILSLVQGTVTPLPAYLMLALTYGFAGVLISPLHLCFTLSGEYFQASMPAVYRHLLLPTCLLLFLGTGYFLVIQWCVIY